MEKRSVLAKILILVILALAIPSVMPALDPSCEPPYCQGACPDGTYDCTSDWLFASWTNFETALALWYSGYSILVCCNY